MGDNVFVKLGEFSSACLNTVCGVPQGTVSGPKLLIMYINNFKSSVLKFVIFANDTNIFNFGDNIKIVLEYMTEEINKLST